MKQRELKKLCKKLGENFSLHNLSEKNVKIATPFIYEDGDCITIRLDPTGESWRLTDDGDTIFRTGRVPLADLIPCLRLHDTRVEEEEELVKICRPEDFADAFFEFVQCILEVRVVGAIKGLR